MSAAGPTGRCAECNQQVLWVTLDTGKRMPVDVPVDGDGTVACLRDVQGRWMGRVLKADEQPDPWERLHVTHFATCRVRAARAERERAQRATAGVVAQQPGPSKAGAMAPVVTSLDAYRRNRPRGSGGRA